MFYIHNIGKLAFLLAHFLSLLHRRCHHFAYWLKVYNFMLSCSSNTRMDRKISQSQRATERNLWVENEAKRQAQERGGREETAHKYSPSLETFFTSYSSTHAKSTPKNLHYYLFITTENTNSNNNSTAESTAKIWRTLITKATAKALAIVTIWFRIWMHTRRICFSIS